MKRWALLTILLYFLSLSVLVVPLFLAMPKLGKDLLPAFYIWFVPILVLVEGILLLIPIAIVRERPVKKRRIILSSVIAAIPMAALAFGFLGFIVLMVCGEEATGDYLYNWPSLIIPAIAWPVWGILFYRSFSSKEPQSFVSNITQWLLRGSILELLVAVPSHIISRHRDECCAPPFTLIGIATGLSIALMSFGPGLFFLFARRIQDKNRKQYNSVKVSD